MNNALHVGDMCSRRDWQYINPDYFYHRLLDRGDLYPAGRGKGTIARALISAIGQGTYPRTPMMAIREDDYE